MRNELAAPAGIDRLLADLPGSDCEAAAFARARQLELTKPPGSLGRLEDIAVWMAGWQGRERPDVERVHALVFAGNHGVTARGVSPYPPEVTVQMVANFKAGGAAINQICRAAGIALAVVPLALDRPTADIAAEAAMSEAECLEAFCMGVRSVPGDIDLLVVGEMGIGNTTIAAALSAALFGGAGADWAGPGTGLDADGVSLKARTVDAALSLHRDKATSPFEMLRRLGGREQAAIAGAVLAARRQRTPVVLDGFVSTASAATLTLGNADALAHCLAGHLSGEPGHRALLKALGLSPLLDLGMRLGEGTGAALAVHVIRTALVAHNGMATFAEAGVSGRAE